MSEQDRKSLPEFPHEGPPYQGYGPAPYQPPAPVPPPVPVGYEAPYQQMVPHQQPPPPSQPLPVRQYQRPRAPSPGSSATSDGEIVQKWGYVMAFSTLIMPILGLVGMILGIITATKPGRSRHGAAIIAVSLVLAVLAAAVWAGLYED